MMCVFSDALLELQVEKEALGGEVSVYSGKEETNRLGMVHIQVGVEPEQMRLTKEIICREKKKMGSYIYEMGEG